MANMLEDVRVTLGALVDEDVNRNKTFYVAEITGDSPKYGLSREFVTDKRSPYTLDREELEVGGVYEIKDDREDLRCWFKITGLADGPLPFEIITLDRGDSCDEDFVLDHVEGYESGDDDGSGAGPGAGVLMADDRREDLAHRINEADAETLDRVEAMLDAAESDAERAGDHTRVSLSNVPEQARKDAKTHRAAFNAAFEKHTDADAGPLLEAVASDAAVLALQTDD